MVLRGSARSGGNRDATMITPLRDVRVKKPGVVGIVK